MVARTRIRCLVVALSESDRLASRGALAREVLPWADPYVAGLIRKLQEEVRQERRVKSLVRNRLSLLNAADDEMLYVQ